MKAICYSNHLRIPNLCIFLFLINVTISTMMASVRPGTNMIVRNIIFPSKFWILPYRHWKVKNNYKSLIIIIKPFNNYKIILNTLIRPNTICTSVVLRSLLHETLLKQWSFKNLKKPESNKIILKLGLQPQWNIKNTWHNKLMWTRQHIRSQ